MRPDDHDESVCGLAKDLRDASDRAILRVTQVVDGLAVRGDTDRLLDGLRPRLAGLRPPRPSTLGRVLFAILDPVIVATGDWRSGSASIPRGLLAPVLALIRSHLPDRAAIERSLAMGQAPQPSLWEHAAAILAAQPFPPGWSLPPFQAATGLKAQSMQPLVATIRLVFTHAATVRLRAEGREPPGQTTRPLLQQAARSGPVAWSIVLALLFEHSTAPAALIEDILALARETAFATQLERSLQGVLRTVIERLQQDEPHPVRPEILTDAALDAQARKAARLAGFSALRGELLAAAGGLAARRTQLASRCAAQLADGLRGAPAACLPSGPLAPEAEDAAAERLETRLRALRRLDLAARRLGDAGDREQVLAQAAFFYAGTAAPDWLTGADRLRLCEILVGAEAALRLAEP